uniref:Ig-like domain-containing protein n=1 Tax=Electrophorus electricus TaxID=8005 RepID=A0AAY5F3V9_ELEEL
MERALLILTLVSGIFCEDQIGPKEEILNIHSDASLSCTYDGSLHSLHWYLLKPGSRPEFLQLIDEETKVFLLISSATVSVSALYYCALESSARNPNYPIQKSPHTTDAEP